MSFGIALGIGLLAGAHTSTWGMYKDSPYEGFAWRKYFRSVAVSALVALAWQAVAASPERSVTAVLAAIRAVWLASAPRTVPRIG